MQKLAALILSALLLSGCATADRTRKVTYPDGTVEETRDRLNAFMSEQSLDDKGYHRGRTIDRESVKKGAKLALDLLQ